MQTNLDRAFRETILLENTDNELYNKVIGNPADILLDIASEIPLIKYVVKGANGIIALSDQQFVKKIFKYLVVISGISLAERYKFIGEIEVRGRDNAGALILSLIDRIDNINKIDILTNLTKARVYNEISLDDYFRLTTILERITYIDLDRLETYAMPIYEAGITDLLYTTGVLKLHTLDSGGANGGGIDKFILSDLGVLFVRHGLKKDIPDIEYHPTRISSTEWSYVDTKGNITRE
ncbi:MAG: hypothetical protein ACRC3Z_09725 [Phocaeicola sp.]